MVGLEHFTRRLGVAAAALALAIGVNVAGQRDVQALTFVLDFDSLNKTTFFGDITDAFNATPFGFTRLSDAAVQTSILDAVSGHHLDYVSIGADPSSPLPEGKELNLSFEIGTVGAAPGNGDSEYFYLGIGDSTVAGQPFGRACVSCVRDDTGAGPSVAIGAVVGSVFTDVLDDIAGIASNDAINLIAGTTSHEIGHTLSLLHAGAQAANPGASAGV